MELLFMKVHVLSLCICQLTSCPLGCYGVPEQEDIREDRSDLSSFTTVPWFCDTCKAGITSALCVGSTLSAGLSNNYLDINSVVL